MCSLFERVTIFCVILGMKQTVNTRRESGICQFPPLFYFRVSQPLRNLFSPFFSSFKFSLNRVQIYIYITQFFKPLWNCILKKNQLETKSHYSLPVKKNRFRNTTYYHVSAQHQDLGSRHKPPLPFSISMKHLAATQVEKARNRNSFRRFDKRGFQYLEGQCHLT